jgi:hypothetical protein
MDINAFKQSLSGTTPPALSVPLQALWQEAKGDWHKAHDLLQDENGGAGAWVHAYLHRKEGDNPNAAYWYRRAGQSVASGGFEAEWEAIVIALLDSKK